MTLNPRHLLDLFDRSRPGFRLGAVVGVWVALGLGAVNIRVFLNDNIPNVLLPLSLLRQGDLELSEFTSVLEREPQNERYWAVRSDHGMFSKYPVWTAVLVAPLFAPLAWWQEQVGNEYFWLSYGRFVALGFSAVFAGSLACTLRRRMPGRWALFLTLCVCFGSAVWHHVGSHLTNQVLPVVCLALMMLLLTRPSMSGTAALCLGGLAGLAFAARLPTVFAAGLPLGVFLTRRAWRRYIPHVVLSGLVFPVLTTIYNTVAFGHPLKTGYSYYAKDAFSAGFWEGAAGLLVSPTSGLFFYSPFLIVGVWSAVQCVRGRVAPEVRDLGLWLILGAAGQWLLFAKWYCWNGALTFGSRMLAETVVLLAVLISLGWSTLSAGARRLLLETGCLAIVHHLVGTVAYDRVAPTEPLKWDWRITEDFIALYIRHHGTVALLFDVLKHGAVFLAVMSVAGYLASRFFESEEDSVKSI